MIVKVKLFKGWGVFVTEHIISIREENAEALFRKLVEIMDDAVELERVSEKKRCRKSSR